MRSEKAAVERHHDQLQSDLERYGTDTSRALGDSSNGGPGEAETLLRQVQVRILGLEAQERMGCSVDLPCHPPVAPQQLRGPCHRHRDHLRSDSGERCP